MEKWVKPSVWENSTTLNFDENNFLTFKTRRNRKLVLLNTMTLYMNTKMIA
jgi:hypothetical protein